MGVQQVDVSWLITNYSGYLYQQLVYNELLYMLLKTC